MVSIISFYLNSVYPDLFAASIYVSGQWDPKVLDCLAEDHFFYISAEGDEKASSGIKQVRALLDELEVSYSDASWDAQLSKEEQYDKVQQMLAEGNNANFITFELSTVISENLRSETDRYPYYEHMYGFDYPYLLDGVREWLFTQTK